MEGRRKWSKCGISESSGTKHPRKHQRRRKYGKMGGQDKMSNLIAFVRRRLPHSSISGCHCCICIALPDAPEKIRCGSFLPQALHALEGGGDEFP